MGSISRSRRDRVVLVVAMKVAWNHSKLSQVDFNLISSAVIIVHIFISHTITQTYYDSMFKAIERKTHNIYKYFTSNKEN